MGDVKIEINVEPMLNGPEELSTMCPYCLGSGWVKAMQSHMTYDAGSIREAYTTVCNGTGTRR